MVQDDDRGEETSWMHELTRIGIKRFRRLHDINFEMRPLMVMIGANGVGKTSVLDAISLLSASASGTMSSVLGGMGGFSGVVTKGCTDAISLSASMEVADHQPLEYVVDIEPKGQTYTISKERLTQTRTDQQGPFKHIESYHGDIRYFDIGTGHLVKPEWEHDPFETSLSQVPKMFRQPEDLRRALGSVTQYHVLDIGTRSPVRLPQQMRPVNLPGADGEDIVPFLYYLREADSDRFEVIEDTLKSAFPTFEYLNFPPAAAGMLSLTWKDKNFRDPLYIHQLSEGTLRFLWLVSLLHSPGLSTVTMIDEPEVSLHPELLSLLADLMREASLRTKIIVATHSDRLIRFLEPGEVSIMDIDDDGFAKRTWGDELDLDEWLGEYSLDELWRMNRIGGRQ